MRYQEIGQSGIKASCVTFGAMGIGGGFHYPDADDAVSIRAVQEAVASGINLIDTAPVYGFGHSEEVIGKAIKGHRDEVVISTKCGLWWGDDEGSYRFTWDGHAVKRNLSARTIRIELENSLRNLQTDYIDIYYTHNPCCPPFMTPIEETIDVLNEFKKEGKIRTIGVSNCEVHHIQSYLDRGDLSIVQRKFSMLDRSIMDEIFPFAQKNGLSFHGYSPLEKGLLSGNVGHDYVVPEGDARTEGGKIWTKPSLDYCVDFADGLKNEVAAELGLSLTELTIAYSLHYGINPICGIRKPHHVEAIAKAADVVLSDETVAEIERRVDALQATLAQVD